MEAQMNLGSLVQLKKRKNHQKNFLESDFELNIERK